MLAAQQAIESTSEPVASTSKRKASAVSVPTAVGKAAATAPPSAKSKRPKLADAVTSIANSLRRQSGASTSASTPASPSSSRQPRLEHPKAPHAKVGKTLTIEDLRRNLRKPLSNEDSEVEMADRSTCSLGKLARPERRSDMLVNASIDGQDDQSGTFLDMYQQVGCVWHPHLAAYVCSCIWQGLEAISTGMPRFTGISPADACRTLTITSWSCLILLSIAWLSYCFAIRMRSQICASVLSCCFRQGRTCSKFWTSQWRSAFEILLRSQPASTSRPCCYPTPILRPYRLPAKSFVGQSPTSTTNPRTRLCASVCIGPATVVKLCRRSAFETLLGQPPRTPLRTRLSA
jgi:hypothetical protein